MDFFSLMCVLFVLGWCICAIMTLFVDADLTLTYYDKRNKGLGNLKEKVVWITGASDGIGAACAVEAAKHGAKLVISARNKTKLEQTKVRCLEAGKDENLTSADVLILQMDVTKFDKHQECVEKVMQHFGKISIVLHNAGRSQRARWEHIDIQVDKDLWELNVLGPVALTRRIMPYFLEKGGGQVAVMSSVAGKAGVPFSGTYTGTKWGVNGYFESLRTERIKTIDVTILCPGPTTSNLLAVAATEKAGEEFQGSADGDQHRMSAERCARLSMLAIANKVDEAWISKFPVLPICYAFQYLPTITRWCIRLIGPNRLHEMRDRCERDVDPIQSRTN